MNGEYIVFSDIQGKFENLNRFFKSIKAMKREGMICLGDIVHKFTEYTDNLCVERVRTSADYCVRGNHEDKFNNRTPQVTPSYNLDYVNQLPDILDLGNVLLMHSSVREKNFRNNSLEQIKDEALYIRGKYPEVRYILFGHTHAVGAYRIENKEIVKCEGDEIELDPNGLNIINPGGIGLSYDMPNTFARINFDTGILRFFHLEESEYLAKKAAIVHQFEEKWMTNLNPDFFMDFKSDLKLFARGDDTTLQKVFNILQTFDAKKVQVMGKSKQERFFSDYSLQLAEAVYDIYEPLSDLYEMEDPFKIRDLCFAIIEEED